MSKSATANPPAAPAHESPKKTPQLLGEDTGARKRAPIPTGTMKVFGLQKNGICYEGVELLLVDGKAVDCMVWTEDLLEQTIGKITSELRPKDDL